MPGLSRDTDRPGRGWWVQEGGCGAETRPSNTAERVKQLSREETNLPVQVGKQRAEPEQYLLYGKEKEKSETWMSLWGFQSES